jgi:hypothetical protein
MKEILLIIVNIVTLYLASRLYKMNIEKEKEKEEEE